MVSSTSTVHWGLTGAGNVCEHKGGPPLYELPGHELLAVTRRDPERGADFARRHGPSRYVSSLEELLALPEIDAVYVATPPALHCEQTIAAARAGKHVLVEKPMAMHAGECDRMVKACGEAGVMLAVAYYRRGYPAILRARELIREGVIGRLRTIWINNQFPPSHRLDLVHFFAGEVATVRTEQSDGAVRLCGETRSGAGFTMDLAWAEVDGRPEQLRFIGESGELFIDDLKGGSLVCRGQRETFAPLPWTHWGLVENFGEALQGAAPLACDGMEGRKSTAVLDVVSALVPDAPAVEVDYENPPDPDALKAAGLNLLG